MDSLTAIACTAILGLVALGVAGLIYGAPDLATASLAAIAGILSGFGLGKKSGSQI